MGSGRILAPKRILEGVWSDSCAILESRKAQLGTKMDPMLNENRAKIDAKIDQKIEASWNLSFRRILVKTARENGGKLASKSIPKSTLTSNGDF